MRQTPKFIDLLKDSNKDANNYSLCKISIVGDSSTQHFAAALKGQAYREKINLDVFDAPYNQLEAQLTNKESETFKHNPDFIIINMSSTKLIDEFYSMQNKECFADYVLNKITRYWESIKDFSNIKIIQNNFAYINDYLFGNYSLKEKSAFAFQLQKINYLLSEKASEYKNVFLLDLISIQSEIGTSKFYDPKMYYSSKISIALDALPLVAINIIDIIKASMGRIKKCIILDLDNTLWGGVIGDDGIEHIELGDLGTGQAYIMFQKWLKALKNRGIILCVCSKNNLETAQKPFIEHPEMILKLEDISLFVANWEDKASNIKYIQQTLNIGMDSIVFIDDNPFERNLVKQAFPDIEVPNLPQDPALYLKTIQEYNYFETVSFSNEDSSRAKMYLDEDTRNKLKGSFLEYTDYLKSLDMRCKVSSFDKFHAPRIAQLTQRSNQFNLRTVRYLEEEILQFIDNDRYITRQYILSDQIGDYGLIGVVILEKQENKLFVNELLMSCRVLKRGMEEFIFNDIVNIAKSSGFSYVVGEYLPTEKNSMVKDLYLKMGFKKESESRFVLDVKDYIDKETFIKEI